MIRIINAETGEVIEREMTAAEVKQSEKDSAEAAAHKAALANAQTAKSAILDRLGLTADEAKILLS